uniref:Uncharacterized protein n=1 Tax=Solanum lycopersicum TaxID=4081 RepID=A0A3Q7GWC1_SOLLC
MIRTTAPTTPSLKQIHDSKSSRNTGYPAMSYRTDEKISSRIKKIPFRRDLTPNVYRIQNCPEYQRYKQRTKRTQHYSLQRLNESFSGPYELFLPVLSREISVHLLFLEDLPK